MTDVQQTEQHTRVSSETENTTPVKNEAVGGGSSSDSSTKKKKSQRSKATHPPTSEMVNNAIKTLQERNGSSLQAIKKYMASNYKVDAEKMAPFIKKFLKTAIAAGAIVQTKGKGASGSFKLPSVSAKKSSRARTSSLKKKPAAAVSKTAKARAISTKKSSSASSLSSEIISVKRDMCFKIICFFDKVSIILLVLSLILLIFFILELITSSLVCNNWAELL
nr:histone H1A, sperm-like [Onthophagus taurus]